MKKVMFPEAIKFTVGSHDDIAFYSGFNMYLEEFRLQNPKDWCDEISMPDAMRFSGGLEFFKGVALCMAVICASNGIDYKGRWPEIPGVRELFQSRLEMSLIAKGWRIRSEGIMSVGYTQAAKDDAKPKNENILDRIKLDHAVVMLNPDLKRVTVSSVFRGMANARENAERLQESFELISKVSAHAVRVDMLEQFAEALGYEIS